MKDSCCQYLENGDLFPALRPDLDGGEFRESTVSLELSVPADQVKKFCRENNIVEEIFFFSAFSLVLARFAAEKIGSCTALEFIKSFGKVIPKDILEKTEEYAVISQNDNVCSISLKYDAAEYSESLMLAMLSSYDCLLSGFVRNEVISDISITSSAQLRILDSFNDTDRPFDESQTVVSLFKSQVAANPDKEAVVYKDRRYSYRQVDEISDRIAAYIISKGIKKEETVSILIPRCEWMAIASLGVLKAGCSYQPLDYSYPVERLNFMVKDAEVRLIIADESLISLINDFDGEILKISEIRNLPEATSDRSPVPADKLILLYTSGSTGVPKGVILNHSNLVAFCAWYRRKFEVTPDSKVSAYASYGFDADMMDLYPALTTGATVFIISEDIRLDLIALNDYFLKEKISHAFMTTQVGWQFASNIEETSLKHLLVGGEKLATIDPPAGFKLHNIYGPTECTICVTDFDVNERLKEIPIGSAIDNVRLYVVDELGNRLPVGACGELLIAGRQVGEGYLNRPDLSEKVFIPNPYCKDENYSRMYRTGDIVRYLPSGNIQFVGREDGQVKIRGFRIELKEVEGVILQFPGIKDATVQAYDYPDGGKYIAAFIVADEPVDVKKLEDFILATKPPYLVPEVIMQIDAIPLNQNQKVNKKALPVPVKKADESPVETAEDYKVEMNVLEKELHAMVAQIVGTEAFGLNTILGHAGLTSISAIKLAIAVNKKYGVSLNPKTLAKEGSVRSLENDIIVGLLNAGMSGESKSDAAARTSAPLAFTQTGVYFECLKNPSSTSYNITFLLSFPKNVDAGMLQKAVRLVVDAHVGLKTHFDNQGSEIVQTVEDCPPCEVPVSRMSPDALENYKHEFIRPFNLAKAPLYRFEVVETEKDGEIICHLLFDIHHLIFDGTSADLFIRQLCKAIESDTVDRETYSSLDFAADQIDYEKTEAFKKAQKFFAEKLKNCEGATEIPADVKNKGAKGKVRETMIPFNLSALAEDCKAFDITPAHLFFAATAYVVSRYSNTRDVFMTTVSSGRSNLKIADTMGMFVNTLPLAISIDDLSVREFLETARSAFEQTVENENYPFARIAADYNYRADIAYAYQAGMLTQYNIDGQPIKDELVTLEDPRFKINVRIENYGIVIEYDDSFYSEELARNFGESINVVAARLLENADSRIRKISIITPQQAEQLENIREGGTGEIAFRLLHDPVSHFAKLHPEKEALVAVDGTFTYKEFDEITNAVARALRKRGVNPRDRVALLLPRNSRLVLALYGVLKSGAAYIPCDPEYPADRVNLIIEDSEARYIITTSKLLDTVDKDKAIDVEELLKETDGSPIDSGVTPDDLAYIIYTSGSTGRPKGVMLRHEGITNYLTPDPSNVYGYVLQQDVERALCVATISFDVALQDIAAPFAGKTIVMASEDQANNPIDLAKAIQDLEVDMVSATPSRWATWLTSDEFCRSISSIKVARAEGEKFPETTLHKIQSLTDAKILNIYGPTEITICSNIKDLTDEKEVTVGKPLYNVKEFVVDVDGNELPVGVVGELYIGGLGVARGYNNLDKMTAERFIDYNGERIYKSGDYARWLPNGEVIILGRTDNQIKLRGLRIELGEIESAIQKVPGIKKVVVVIRKINDKEHLCAYYTADREISGDEIKDIISKHLTQYMVPTAYMQLPEMPMTPNGKTDQKALPTPQLATSETYVKPANDAENDFCEIFSNILSLDKVGATDNFFHLGGTSLIVTRVIIEADKKGYHIAFRDVFANPTPRKLALLVTGEVVEDGNEVNIYDDFDYSQINHLLKTNTLEAFRTGNRVAFRNVLVTGPTGYLGIHILRELIESDAENIYCLVRGKNEEEAAERLKTLLFYYFDSSYEEQFGSRIHVVVGDVTSKIDIDAEIDTVFNCAAVVKHFSEGTEIEDVNIGGAENCIDLCLRKDARLVHISTTSTAGLWIGPMKDLLFSERDLYIGQYLDNQYIGSKFIAERTILDSVLKKGLKAKIMRVGNLAPRSTDGEFQANFSTNAFMGRIKVYNMLGCCPYSQCTSEVEFSPINEVAASIILLSTTPENCRVFHPFNIHAQYLADVLKGLRKVGVGVRFVEQEEFNEAMDEAKADPQKSKILASLLAYQDMAHGQEAEEVLSMNDYTTQVLYRLGFSWSPTSWDYVEKMIMAIGGLGFFD